MGGEFELEDTMGGESMSFGGLGGGPDDQQGGGGGFGGVPHFSPLSRDAAASFLVCHFLFVLDG